MRRPGAALMLAGALLVGCSSGDATTGTTDTDTTGSAVSTPRATGNDASPHVFVIMLENTNYDVTFGSDSDAPYLSTELAGRGALLTKFYGVTHHSLPNYIAQISGQAPNPTTQHDCGKFVPFERTGTGDYDQALGDGCVYPADVPTIADQLQAAGLTWRAYAQDMAASSDAPTTCRHPVIGEDDPTGGARDGDNFATKHVPFLYFRSIIDSPDCDTNLVDLNELPADLASLGTTPNLAYIVPGLCDDAHDGTCVDGRKGGIGRADTWLREWVPKILASPAMAADGLLVITFDEAGSDDSSWCCGPRPAPNLTADQNIGGGRVGAVVLGTAVAPGTVSDTPYDQYSLLCTLERLWGLDLLGLAAHPSTACFGADVFSADPSFMTP